MAEVLFKEERWFGWVSECLDEEERGREKEREKVKAEAALFKRHWKAAQLRARDLKAKEDKMRQDAYLEQVYKESLAMKERNGEGEETDDDEMDWDPIEDVLEDNRGSYLGMFTPPLLLSILQTSAGACSNAFHIIWICMEHSNLRRRLILLFA